MQDYYRHTITRILYSRMPRSPDEAADALQKMIIKKDDEMPKTSDFTSGAGAFTKALMKKFAPTISAHQRGRLPQGGRDGGRRHTARLREVPGLVFFWPGGEAGDQLVPSRRADQRRGPGRGHPRRLLPRPPRLRPDPPPVRAIDFFCGRHRPVT